MVGSLSISANDSKGLEPLLDVVIKGVRLNVGPWQLTPPPYELVTYGPCKTCTAWFVTLPVDVAWGFAIAVTGVSPSAYAGRTKTLRARTIRRHFILLRKY